MKQILTSTFAVKTQVTEWQCQNQNETRNHISRTMVFNVDGSLINFVAAWQVLMIAHPLKIRKESQHISIKIWKNTYCDYHLFEQLIPDAPRPIHMVIQIGAIKQSLFCKWQSTFRNADKENWFLTSDHTCSAEAVDAVPIPCCWLAGSSIFNSRLKNKQYISSQKPVKIAYHGYKWDIVKKFQKWNLTLKTMEEQHNRVNMASVQRVKVSSEIYNIK